jgi:hypothetical protein
MSYNLEDFVNNNNSNFAYTVTDVSDDEMFETLPEMFAKKFKFDIVHYVADPVFVYELDSVPVAWYDCENMCGFVA